MSRYLLLAVATLALGACGPRRYTYAPVITTSAEAAGLPATENPFPPAAPTGAVRLGTFGLTSLDSGQHAVHLRMVVANRGVQTWTVREAEQRIAVGNGVRHEILATTRRGEPPSAVDVLPGTDATLDLYFPLPPRQQTPESVGSFDAVWTVRIGDVAFTKRTAFQRFRASDFGARPSPADPFESEGAPQVPARQPPE